MMTPTKGFPRLLVPRPPPNTKPSVGVRSEKPLGYVTTPDPVMHASRPVDRIKPPARYIAPLPAGVVPKRPEHQAPDVEQRERPSFVTGRLGSRW